MVSGELLLARYGAKPWLDLFDNMYELVDSLTFKLRSISPSMWPVFELTYKLFKSDAVDFLDGRCNCSGRGFSLTLFGRDVALLGQLCIIWW